MPEQKFIKILQDLGLSEKEAVVYVAALAAGPASIITLARSAQVRRTTVYSVVESLKQKGLIRIELQGWKKFYAAESPENLERVLESRKQQLKALLPEFSALYNLSGGESFIKYYEGLEAVKTVYESFLEDVRPHEDYLIISDQSKWISLDEEYFLDFTNRRAKLPINIRMLQIDSPTARHFKRLEKNYNYTIRFLPKGTQLTTNLVVIPRRLMIHQLTPPIMAIVIENKSVIQMHRELFEIIWRAASGE